MYANTMRSFILQNVSLDLYSSVDVSINFPKCGSVHAQIKIPSAENPEVSTVLSLKPEISQNIATCASSTAGKFSLSNFYLPD